MIRHVILAKMGANQRLDKFLTDVVSGSSRTTIKKMINEGLVTVNGETSKPSLILNGNEEISYQVILKEESDDYLVPENIELDIIYEDTDIIAINKPAGLTVHPGAGQKTNTLANGLIYHFRDLSNINGKVRPGIVHRLDKQTSGVMLVAKNNEAHTNLSRQFEAREIKKEYYAVTWGIFSSKEGKITLPLSRSKKDPTSYVGNDNGKKAITSYTSKSLGDYTSEVIFKPKTGRTHQIRVHSASLGNPIFGDSKYGGGNNRSKGFLPEVSKILNNSLKNLGRHALHSKSITFSHPSNKKLKSISAKIPAEFETLKIELSSLHV